MGETRAVFSNLFGVSSTETDDKVQVVNKFSVCDSQLVALQKVCMNVLKRP